MIGSVATGRSRDFPPSPRLSASTARRVNPPRLSTRAVAVSHAHADALVGLAVVPDADRKRRCFSAGEIGSRVLLLTPIQPCGIPTIHDPGPPPMGKSYRYLWNHGDHQFHRRGATFAMTPEIYG